MMLKVSKRYRVPFYSLIVSPFGIFTLLVGLYTTWGGVGLVVLGGGLMVFVCLSMIIWINRGGLDDDVTERSGSQ